MKSAIYIYLLFLCVSCGTGKKVNSQSGYGHPDSIFASMERGPCFGRCPAYSAIIYNSGRAVYEGRSSVTRQGLFTGTASADQMKKLSEEALRLRLDTLKNQYVNPRLSDFPSHSFSILINGVRKQVYVMDTEPPGSISLFETLLEAQIEKIDWVKQESDH